MSFFFFFDLSGGTVGLQIREFLDETCKQTDVMIIGLTVEFTLSRLRRLEVLSIVNGGIHNIVFPTMVNIQYIRL